MMPAVPTSTATVKIHRNSRSITIATYFQSSIIWHRHQVCILEVFITFVDSSSFFLCSAMKRIPSRALRISGQRWCSSLHLRSVRGSWKSQIQSDQILGKDQNHKTSRGFQHGNWQQEVKLGKKCLRKWSLRKNDGRYPCTFSSPFPPCFLPAHSLCCAHEFDSYHSGPSMKDPALGKKCYCYNDI